MPSSARSVLASSLAFAALLAAARPARAQCSTYSGLTYATYVDQNGSTQPLLLDLLVPAAAAPVPLVLWIHGGGWTSGSRTPIPNGPTGLCARGYAVASVDYRFSPTWTWPTQIQDVKGAVRWLRANAATYNLDPDRFGAWGASAGGQLASMLGTAGDLGSVTIGNLTVDLEGTVGGNNGFSSRVQAVADWYGPTDFLAMHFYPMTVNHDAQSSDESHLVGGPLPQNPERVASADPITFVSADDPPFVVMHGALDDLIPFNQSELLVDALRAVRVPVSFVPVPNVGHGGSNWETTANYQVVYDFLDANLKNLGSPTVSVTRTADAAEAGPVSGRFHIARTGSTAAPLAVRWALSGTAQVGTDYAAPLAGVTLPAGAASVDVTVDPVQDSLVEGDETVILRLAPDPAYRIDSTRSSATVTIADDDSPAGLPVVTVQATDASASEAGPAPGTFTVSLDAPLAADLTVRYTVAGTATNGVDYAPLSGAVTIPAGATTAAIEVDPVADGVAETTETVILTLAPGTAYAIGAPATASVAIADADFDPTATTLVALSATDPNAAETGPDPGTLTLYRTGNKNLPLTVNLHLAGTAKNGIDYNQVTTATFASGVAKTTLNISPIDDDIAEGPETVIVSVDPSSGVLTGPYQPTVTIQDNEPWPGPMGLYTLPPCRLADTRWPASPVGAPALAAGEIRIVPVSGHCGVPPEAIAVSVNVTVVNPAAVGSLTLFEPGAPRPITTTLSFQAGQNRANNALLPLLGRPSALALYLGLATGTADVVIDVNGYFE